jgi:hypothetical protein
MALEHPNKWRLSIARSTAGRLFLLAQIGGVLWLLG